MDKSVDYRDELFEDATRFFVEESFPGWMIIENYSDGQFEQDECVTAVLSQCSESQIKEIAHRLNLNREPNQLLNGTIISLRTLVVAKLIVMFDFYLSEGTRRYNAEPDMID